MKKLFIHFPLFRFLSPFATGTLVYLLILLVNNNVEQLSTTFLGRELYVCIGLALIIQESARLSLLAFEKIGSKFSELLSVLIQGLWMLSFSVAVVTLVMKVYFHRFLGYSPNVQELLIFNILFGFLTIIYFLLYKGHQLLFRINQDKLMYENDEISRLTDDYKLYAERINSELLFESLETLMVIMRRDPELAESFTDDFSVLYRYKLRSRSKELLPLSEELTAAQKLVRIYSFLPYRRMTLLAPEGDLLEEMVIPGVLLSAVEKIIKSTLVSSDETMEICVQDGGTHILLQYEATEKLRGHMDESSLSYIAEKYAFYTEIPVDVLHKDPLKSVRIPKLLLYEGSDN